VIQPTITSSGQPAFAASVNGIAIYLDNWAIKDLAKGEAKLRERLVAVVNNGADVLFSSAHALEALGPQGRSSDAFRTFLNQLGAHWYPVESNVFKVLERESAGKSGSDSSFDEELLRAYFQSATAGNVRGSGTIIDLSESFFKLGNWIDWLAPQRGELDRLRAEYERMLQDYVVKLRDKFKKKPALLNVALPAIQFSPSAGARFAFVHLMRDLITDRGFQVKQGDAMDLGHAVVASAFANFATLDKQWKRRVELLPKPNGNPRIYYEPELEDMVTDLEIALAQLRSQPKGAPMNLPLRLQGG
jgi:hypothetical protein